MRPEDNYRLSLQGAIVLLFRQWYLLDDVLEPAVDHWFWDGHSNTWTPVRALVFVETFFETWLYGFLMIALIRDPRWRFALTLYLYLGYLIVIAFTVGVTVGVLGGYGGVSSVLLLVVAPAITWYNTYRYVEKVQKARDRLRGVGRRTANGGTRIPRENGIAPRPHEDFRLDPTGVYSLVPSQSEPPLPYIPCWEQDEESWYIMAKTVAHVRWGMYQFWGRLIGFDRVAGIELD